MKISIIVPLFNEEANLQKGILEEILAYAKKKKEIGEILLVDDGSTDKTVSIIKKMYPTSKTGITLLEKKHSGKAYSVIAGIRKAQHPYVLFTDADLATPIQEADKLIAALHNENEIVIGSRSTERKGAPFIRKAMTIGFIFLRTLLVGLRGISDTQCGFKAFQKKAALAIIDRLSVYDHEEALDGPSVSAGFDLEFLFVAQKLGYRICSVPVTWRHVETKRVNFITDSLEAVRDLLTIRFNDIQNKYSA